MGEQSKELLGGCACGHIRYKTTSNPFIVHCCHCRQCQRLSGAAFAINALFEASHVKIQQGEPEIITVNTPSGKGQKVSRCPKCKVAVWSNYYMSGIQDLIRFVRVGTLDNPDHCTGRPYLHRVEAALDTIAGRQPSSRGVLRFRNNVVSPKP